MTARRARTRAPQRTPAPPVVGQWALFGSEEPWQPTGCTCWPPTPRGCHHCRTCDTCHDCHQCAGRGCHCSCEEI